MKRVTKFEFTLPQSLINCSCTKETDTINPVFFPVMVSQKPFHLPAAEFLPIAESNHSVLWGLDPQFLCGSIFKSWPKDCLPCKLNFHSPCGSHYSLLVKKQLCNRVHHWASTNRDTYTHGLRASSWKAIVWLTQLYYRFSALWRAGELALASKWWNNVCCKEDSLLKNMHFWNWLKNMGWRRDI